jgi:hypothetical protein
MCPALIQEALWGQCEPQERGQYHLRNKEAVEAGGTLKGLEQGAGCSCEPAWPSLGIRGCTKFS